MLSGDDFAAVLKSRERKRSAHFSLHWRSNATPGGTPAARLGLVVSKKLARTSVRRNLIKRQTRMLFAGWVRELPQVSQVPQGPEVSQVFRGWDVVLKLTANVSSLPRAEQFGEIAGLLRALPKT